MKKERWLNLNVAIGELEKREHRTDEGDTILDAFDDAVSAGDDAGPFAEWFERRHRRCEEA